MRKIILFLYCITFSIGLFSQDNDAIRIAFLTDIHVNPGADTEENLRNIVNEINIAPFDFVVVTGDLTNTGSDAELKAVHQVLSGLRAPLYIVPGNHETNWSESACQTFNQLWGSDRFYFTKGKYRFIGFSTGPYMKMGDGHVRQEDINWLAQTLEKSEPGSSEVISLAHYPLSEGLANWYTVTDILKKHNTKLVLCGHGHRLSKHNFDGIPGLMGRSSLPKGYQKPGYNILTIRNDSVYLDEKKLDVDSIYHFTAFSLNNPGISALPLSSRPEFAINDQYKNRIGNEIIFNLQDSASIFTGVVPVTEKLVAYGNSVGAVKMVNTDDQSLKWKKELTGSIYSTPSANKKVLAIGSIDGSLSGLRIKDGKQLWKTTLNGPIIAEGVVEADNLYIGAGNNTFYKLNLRNGHIIWRNDSINGQMQGKPVITANEVIFGAWDTYLYCIDKNTGILKWKWNNGSTQKLYSPGNVIPVVSNGKVFIVAPDRYMTAIDLKTGKTIWRDNSKTVRESMGISSDGQSVYAKLMNDKIIAVSTSANYFDLKWEVDAAFGYEHNPCPILEHNGVVYAGTKNGVLIAIDVLNQKLLWKHKAGNSSVNKITADKNGNIWISLIEGKILAYNH